MKQLPKLITELYKELKNITWKLHQTAGSISFRKKTLHHEVIPKFAQVKGNFTDVSDRYKSENCILLSHLNNHVPSNKLLIKKHHPMSNYKVPIINVSDYRVRMKTT